ncbi:MAG: hypothetical protein JST30_13015 [Armatimonadetes bacterium]|nr:hypothetical protein [Armatimonadota bacterium]
MAPGLEEVEMRSSVLEAVLQDVRNGRVIRLPDPVIDGTASATALHLVGSEPNPYGGMYGPYRYQFEGEDDLLHLFVARSDGDELTPEEGRTVAAWVLETVPPGLVWFKPGRFTQHFYLGHDDLVAALSD